MLQCVIAGESHGSALIAVCSGLLAGVELDMADLEHALARRRLGYGRGARQKFERDYTRVLSGLRHGKTLGSPLAIGTQNSEWCKWTTVVSSDRVPPEALLVDTGKGDSREAACNKILTKPRPGHADFAGTLRYGFTDVRNVLERFSARETAVRVALGTVAEAPLAQVTGIHLVSHVVSLGDTSVPDDAAVPNYADTEALDEDPMCCFDTAISDKIMARLEVARQSRDTLGGLVEVLAYGVPAGLGSYVSAGRRLGARLAAAMVSIQTIKGVEVGRTFRQAALPGSQAHDPIYLKSEQTPHESEKTSASYGVWRPTNLAGGIEGGMSNGSPIMARAPVGPISTVPQALSTVSLATRQPAVGLHQHSNTTAMVPAAVVT